MFKVRRILGQPLKYATTSVEGVLNRKTEIQNALKQHGCVCLKGIEWTPQQQVQFTKGMWNDVIKLPESLSFNNQDSIYKEVARVGNIKIDGTMKDSQKQAAYWHQDGNFWGKGKNHIFNVLQTKIEPTKGGSTHVMDLVEGARFIKQMKPKLYDQMLQLQGVTDLEQIKDFMLYGAKNTLNVETITIHKLLTNVKWNNSQTLYLTTSIQKVQNIKTKQQSKLNMSQIIALLEKEMGYYAHQWEKGDALIWDNIQTMHRSSGQFEGPRLLFRTQGRLN